MDFKIKPGDWLSKIAPQYGMTWQELYEYDGGTGKTNRERLNEQKQAKGRPEKSLDNPDLIYPDDIILVPDEPSQEKQEDEQPAEEKAPDEPKQPAPKPSRNKSKGDAACPSYVVTIGKHEFTSDGNPGVLSIRVVRSIGLPTDSCEVNIVESKDCDFKKTDSLKVQLGYGTQLNPVFSGFVEKTEHELSKVRVTALGIGINLLHLRLNRVYLNQTAGRIVSSIAQEAKVKIKTASDGINLPMYAVDDATNGYEHILNLANRCNYNAYITEDDQLEFKEPKNLKSTPMRFAKEIIKIETADYSPLFAGSRICGESPSSTKGADTAHWLTKQEVKGEAGSGTVMSVQDPAIRDNKTAETVAKSRTSKLSCTYGVVVEVVGKPEIKLADYVSLENVPISGFKSPLEIRSFEHYLSKSRGFTTKINCWMRGAGA
jgi:phage protein D